MDWNWGRPLNSAPIWGKVITLAWFATGAGMILIGSTGGNRWALALGFGFMLVTAVAVGMAAGVIPRR
jgi:hypothetical protein